MSTLLRIDSSAKGSKSVTRAIANHFVEKWREVNPQSKVIERDLMETRPAFVDEQLVGAFYTPADQQSAAQKQILEFSDQLIAELLSADTWVFAVPMYNFSVPAVFKAYIDQIVRVGKTFSYATGKPEGLVRNKKLYVIVSSGADYSSGPYSAMDFVEPYLRAIFGFLGITDVTFIKAYGTDEATVLRTSEEALHKIDNCLAPMSVV